jgi:hypothetical protein
MHVERAVGGPAHEPAHVRGLAQVALLVDDLDVAEVAGGMDAGAERSRSGVPQRGPQALQLPHRFVGVAARRRAELHLSRVNVVPCARGLEPHRGEQLGARVHEPAAVAIDEQQLLLDAEREVTLAPVSVIHHSGLIRGNLTCSCRSSRRRIAGVRKAVAGYDTSLAGGFRQNARRLPGQALSH